MPGSASLAANLVNELVPVADELRELRTDFGVNAWNVSRVVRTWGGSRPGENDDDDYTDVATEIEPTPLVGWADEHGRVRFDLPPTGLNESGEIVLAEVSLTYTEAELSGQSASANVEILYLLEDAQGNGMADRYFVVSTPPAPDREKTIGWRIGLKPVAG